MSRRKKIGLVLVLLTILTVCAGVRAFAQTPQPPRSHELQCSGGRLCVRGKTARFVCRTQDGGQRRVVCAKPGCTHSDMSCPAYAAFERRRHKRQGT